MLDEKFADGDSFVHHRDPRGKTVIALAFSALTAVIDRYPPLILAAVIALVLVALAKLPVRAVAYRIAAVNGFLLFLWLMLPLTYRGGATLHLGPVRVSSEGMNYALLITLKSNSIIFAGIALLSTTHLADLGRSLGWLRIPDKITHTLLFMLRYLSVINHEYLRLWTSMKMRCFRPGTNLHTYRSYANMMGMLLITSYESAEAVYAAMRCRGFQGKFHTIDEYAIKGRDIVFASVMGTVLVLIGLVQWIRFLS
ncbi:MAG: cobalt ECF transporter T component CbiQ [Candidatus Lindowbacteria bacterium]|nr:cobalt ECF transporter T component CbiQ [Candidatus Lindowbacteria bacterium]